MVNIYTSYNDHIILCLAFFQISVMCVYFGAECGANVNCKNVRNIIAWRSELFEGFFLKWHFKVEQKLNQVAKKLSISVEVLDLNFVS